MTLLFYFVKLVVISGGLYAYYYCFLRNKSFHLYNRYFLVTSAALAWLFPLLKIDLFSWQESASVFQINMYESLQTITPDPEKDASGMLTAADLTFFLYLLVSLLFILLLIRSLRYLHRIARRYPCHSIENISIYRTEEPGTPFSFFRNIFWNNRIHIESNEGRQILKHELYHVKQMHSFDLILLELMIAMAWINPFFYLMKKELKTIHEFLADEYALTGSDKYEYAELLLLHAMQTKNTRLTNLFFHNQIKRRIAMITRNHHTSFSYV